MKLKLNLTIWIVIVLVVVLYQNICAMQVKGTASVSYETKGFSKKMPDEYREIALEIAKKNAWNQYISTFSTQKMQIYKSLEHDIVSSFDSYMHSITFIDEIINEDAKRYTVVIRANINESAIDAKMSNFASGQGGGDGSLIGFMFVARETESIMSFDKRKTEVETQDTNLAASQESTARGGRASYGESKSTIATSTTGGSSLQKTSIYNYRVRSAGDIDAAMNQVLTSSGFDVVSYLDVYSACGGTSPDIIRSEFSESDEISPESRRGAIDASRYCEVKYFAIGTLDVGVNEVDPVSGNQRVFVSVRGQVWDISSRLPRNVASVGPVQFAGLGPDQVVAMRNALIRASSEGAKVIVEQINAKNLR